MSWLHQLKDGIFGWMEGLAGSEHPGLWLFMLSFAESSFFPLPPDILLIALGVADPEMALVYGLICTVASVLGGGLGYSIGKWGGRPILYRFFNEHKIHAVEELYGRYNAWATGIAGLTPIPYKVFTIGGGAFKIDFKIFMLASLGSRGLRFMVEAVLLYFFGARIRVFLYDYFNWVSLAFVVLLVGGFWAVQHFGRRSSRGEGTPAGE